MHAEALSERLAIPDLLPLLPVRDAVIFPYMTIPLQISREISLRSVEEAMSQRRLLLVVAQKDSRIDAPGPQDLYSIGTVGMVVRIVRQADGRMKTLIQGLTRARLVQIMIDDPFMLSKVEHLQEPVCTEVPLEVEALERTVRESLEELLAVKNLPPEIMMVTNTVTDPGVLADLIASNLNLRVEAAQQVLETIDPVRRLELVEECLQREIHLTRMQVRIQSQAKEEISKSQREYFLREQLRAIQDELGEVDEKNAEIKEFQARIQEAGMPPEAEKEAHKQLRRLESIQADSTEASLVRNYLEWLVELPWAKTSEDNLDIQQVKRVLDEDHYDLAEVKDRILEYLSVRKLKEKMRGPILCFVGPPGVGKTSLGRSIARAMGRRFVRISLGGIHDEAEIRGHRRTYVGAMPGRILQGIKQAETNNPVFMMDEVDKIGMDFRGDPSSALLEVLDPEQNATFSDHYVNIPFDLSKVMFITTANRLDLIPPALRDRMEVIPIPGYTEDEKIHIALKHLIPKQMEENGLENTSFSISRQALQRVIYEYTREAGVRGLEREIARICRKVARMIAEGKQRVGLKVHTGNLELYLGPPRFLSQDDQPSPQIGQATGLAWTQSGGEVLYVEVSVVDGSGELTLTGHLGEVMKESAHAALSYVRATSHQWGIPKNFHKEKDIHIHIPGGSIPKDGPSAGIAMLAAIVSALTQRPVRNDVALTGEITLRGKVLPVGAVKEKILGAHRYDIREVFLPDRNRKDLSELPAFLKKRMRFHFVRSADEALRKVLLEKHPA